MQESTFRAEHLKQLGAGTIENTVIIYIFRSKLMCLSKPEEVTDNDTKTLAHNKFVQFPHIINP